ncbi:MAG: NADH-quinone oxidoreductase subunit L [Deltaproteobacteria bacterium]|nr:NADH-quinone oxidoreductase subunit L [Deltaproteobacteria bacterium]
MIGLEHYIVLSVVLFCIGAFGVLTRRNLLIILMSIEIMLSAANLAFVAFSRYGRGLDGQVIVLFVFVIAACEVAEPISEERLAAKVQALLGLPSVQFYAPPPDRDDPAASPTGITAWLFYALTSLPGSPTAETGPLFQWIVFNGWVVEVGLRLDQLSLVMTGVVTGVGSLIHLYSVGYMGHDKGFVRYFSYLNLFLFFMLILVLADNLLLMFVGWEGVGLCSYLLIGYWFEDPAKAAAGKKAFVVNRIGDFGFLLGIFSVWVALEGQVPDSSAALLNFEFMREMALRPDTPLLPVATAICLLFFIGACGKSAQIPLHVWLPDAMAGPTPVSALIHAATMVTAGVYMIARLNFLYILSPAAMQVVATVGAVTALFAATMGLAQTDIKKVLAYSTISQLGFMFLGVGVGAFSAGVFHLVTHAFFKALLFLGAGSVIHAMREEQRIHAMGGLRNELPITFWTFLTATVAIAGIYPFAGFFSKDAILWETLARGHVGLWVLGVVTAAVTAFYMFRLLGLVFFGSRSALSQKVHVHKEESVTMLLPLICLGFLSFIGGWLGVPAAFGGADHFGHFLAPIFLQEIGSTHASHGTEALVGLGTMLWVGVWAILALAIYAQRREWPSVMAVRFRRAYALLVNDYFVDRIYYRGVVQPLVWISDRVLWRAQDAMLIDRIGVHGTGRAMLLVGRLTATIQTGLAPHYLFFFVLGAVVLVGWFVL